MITHSYPCGELTTVEYATSPVGDTSDATELAELLQFLHDWLTADQEHLAQSLRNLVGTPAYTTSDLRYDLARITFLLGGNNGEPLFHPTPP